MCTVDSNKPFPEFYAEDSQEKVLSQESTSKIYKTEKVLLKRNAYDQNLSSVKLLPSTTEKCITQMNNAKLLKDDNLSVSKTTLANDEDIPCLKLKKFEISKETEGLKNYSYTYTY